MGGPAGPGSGFGPTREHLMAEARGSRVTRQRAGVYVYNCLMPASSLQRKWKTLSRPILSYTLQELTRRLAILTMKISFTSRR